MEKTILEVKNLSVDFATDQGTVRAVRDVSFHVKEGEILGIVGESGSGKSVGMHAIMGLLAANGHVTGGDIIFNEENIARKAFANERAYEEKMCAIRGKEISMIFQNPMSFLNPVLTVGSQLREVIKNHNPKLGKAELGRRTVEQLHLVGIPSPETVVRQYPYALSGGMRQRVVMAIALVNRPKLIIADEPTTSLDVTTQAQVLDIIREMSRQIHASAIVVTHDLGIVASLCDRVIIMYGGKLVETGNIREIFYAPDHPYTKGLLNSVNNPENDDRELMTIPGSPPDMLNPPAGCPFVDRCNKAMRICKKKMPLLAVLSETHSSSCWLRQKEAKQHG
ncbi:MAG: ABC transporter ATP-binding protein [Oscillospiraceae bacterium]|nr:ABC transporter ATP-binding protein [Oscillospiraceae bacterium]